MSFENSSTDPHMVNLYTRYGLEPEPTEQEIRSKALELLGDPAIVLEGFELIVGRRIESREMVTNETFKHIFIIPDARTKLMLLIAYREKADEELAQQQQEEDLTYQRRLDRLSFDNEPMRPSDEQ